MRPFFYLLFALEKQENYITFNFFKIFAFLIQITLPVVVKEVYSYYYDR